jgi:hypothetical protein
MIRLTPLTPTDSKLPLPPVPDAKYNFPPLDTRKYIARLRLPKSLLEALPVDPESVYPVAADPKPKSVDPLIKELQKELCEARKTHAAEVHTLSSENAALKEEIEGLKERLSLKHTKVRERKRLPSKQTEATLAEETLRDDITTLIEQQKHLKADVKHQEETLKTLNSLVRQEQEALYALRDAKHTDEKEICINAYMKALEANSAYD